MHTLNILKKLDRWVTSRRKRPTPSGPLIAQRSPTEQSRGNGVEPTWN